MKSVRVVVVALFMLTFCFNARQEALGAAAAGWVAAWPSLVVAGVRRGSAMARAGVRAGDVIETINGHRIATMTDWFVARSTFERGWPIDVGVRRGGQHRQMQFVINAAAWRTWRRGHAAAVAAFYVARLACLIVASFISFSRPTDPAMQLAALMFAMSSVAEGYPSSGWGAALLHLPLVVALPICVAVASWLLASFAWLAFFAVFTRGHFSAFLLLPLIALAPSLVFSAYRFAHAPWQLLNSSPRALAEAIAGVAPAIYFRERHLIAFWLVVTAFNLLAGFALLMRDARRHLPMIVAVVLFGAVAIQNVLARSSTHAAVSFVLEAVVFSVALAIVTRVLVRPYTGAR